MEFQDHQIIILNGSKFEVRPNLMNDNNVYIMLIEWEKTCQETSVDRYRLPLVEKYPKDRLIKALQDEHKNQDRIDEITWESRDMESFTPERQSEF